MKKYLAILMTLVIVIGLGAAFAEETADPFAELGYYEMKIGHAQPETNVRHLSLLQFEADVEEATHGHIQVEIFCEQRTRK